MFEAHWKQVLETLAELFGYPRAEFSFAVERVYVLLQHDVPLAAREISQFAERTERLALEQLEEIYTRTFEINSKCAPEIGWHLFGEEFTRGMLLVRLREELARYGIPETTELPDHISHVLRLVAAMPREEADRFVPSCVFPALRKMRQSAERMGSPYSHLIAALEELVRHEWGPLLKDEEEEHPSGFPSGVDPLRAFPVLGQDEASCSGCGGGIDPAIDPRQACGGDVPLDELELPTNPRLYGNTDLDH